MELFIPEVKMMSFFCESCQEVKAIPARSGRPPTLCTSCKENGESHNATNVNKLRALAEARCDRLEFMLRSRNTHIKQQKGWHDASTS
jgi:hypothetical protein